MMRTLLNPNDWLAERQWLCGVLIVVGLVIVGCI